MQTDSPKQPAALTPLRRVAVYCASSLHISPEYFAAARELGRLMARAGLQVVCGGGAEGLMAAVIEAQVDEGVTPVGILPRFMVERNWTHPTLRGHEIITPDMRTRKALLLEMAEGVVTLPGGVGTFEEVCEALSFKKLDLWHGPIVFLNTRAYYTPLLRQLEAMYDEGFAERPAEPLYTSAATPAEAVQTVISALK